MPDLVRYSTSGNVAVITIDNPPVNALSPGVPEGIASSVARANSDPSVHAIVLIGAGKGFIAGADIREFGKITSGQKDRGEGLHPLLAAIESSSKPVIAAIHGQAFGGGLEVAMACHYRVLTPEALVGQPEVRLGLIPGAGGTQRLPRLVGVAKAVEMCQFGDAVGAEQAVRIGLADEIISTGLEQGAIAFAARVAGKPFPIASERNDRLGTLAENEKILAAAREAARKRQRNLQAPLAAIEAIEAATRTPFELGIEEEARLFRECLFSTQSKALIHVFFGERAVARIPDVPRETPILPIRRVALVGAGTMGAGIAMCYANAGIPVLLKEVDQQALDNAMDRIRGHYAASVAKGRFSQQAMDQRLSLITPTLRYYGFDEADLILEAAFEDMALKKSIFAELDKVARPGAILATNTSTLSIDEIAAHTQRPHMVIGHHFFSPANVMRLLEIVRGRDTSREVIATSMALARRLGKVGVLVRNGRGFVGNRMFGPYRREAQFLVEEGADISAVDRAMYEFGMAMGPLQAGDLAGLDVGWRIRKEHRHLEAAGVRRPLLEDRLCEMGRYGQKTNAGWYKYDDQRRAERDAIVEDVIAEVRKQAGIAARQIAPDEIRDRLLYTLVNEGAKILEEGIALGSVDIDIIYICGYGFPAYRGGPMFYADSVGLPDVLGRIREFHAAHGDLWRPAPLLERLAAEGKTFESFDRSRVAAA